MMEIRKSTREDLPRILELYENARIFMAQHGNASQWGKTFPPAELIENDIAAGKVMSASMTEKLLQHFILQ